MIPNNSISISSRIFKIVLFGNLLVLILILGLSWFALENLEETVIEIDRQSELEYFQKYGDKSQPHEIHTSRMIRIFQPHHQKSNDTLPIVFQGIPIPFAGEVDAASGGYYNVITHDFPEGIFYLAKNLSVFEEHEERAIFIMVVLFFVLVLFSLILSFVASKKISRPIINFSLEIDSFKNNIDSHVIRTDFVDSELNDIAIAINRLLVQIENATERERKLIAMASHELRTPVAVISGAADVMKNRGTLTADNEVTLDRIIMAAKEMKDNIHSLLYLAKKTSVTKIPETFTLSGLIFDLIESYRFEAPDSLKRLDLNFPASENPVCADKALVRMLLHNLLSNALNHTQGQVTVAFNDGYLDIIDEGNQSEPAAIPSSDFSKPDNATGLGLYIVHLASETLGWRYESLRVDNKSLVRINMLNCV